MNDKSTNEHRFVSIGYVAMFNQFSVFTLVNVLWVLILTTFLKFSIVFSALLFPLGYFVWKLIVKMLELLAETVENLAPKYQKGEGFLKLIVILPFLLLWAIIFLTVSVLHITVRFGIDLPLRVISEKILGEGLLRVFEYVKKTIDKSQRTYLKTHILLGAVFLVFGFLYQMLGVILISLE